MNEYGRMIPLQYVNAEELVKVFRVADRFISSKAGNSKSI
jgi:hypothetical protein